jgi:hypothetical protein
VTTCGALPTWHTMAIPSGEFLTGCGQGKEGKVLHMVFVSYMWFLIPVLYPGKVDNFCLAQSNPNHTVHFYHYL